MKAFLAALSAVLVGVVVGAVVFLTAGPASAATLTQVTNFGSNPSNLNMYVYVPATVSAHPAILVAVHYCTGSAQAFYNGYAHDYVTAADRYGYVIVFPEATRSGQCFDVYSPQALKRGGGSDPVGIMSMVTYAEQHYNGDASRVYVTGVSSGAMMTNVLAAEYPDVFKAGAAFMGVPYGCFATTDGSTWNSQCSGGQIIKTAQQWGDLARSAFPGYTGSYPRMQLWHGTADTTLSYPNFGEEIKQWTNLRGVSQTPTATDHPSSTWTRTFYGGTGSAAPVQGISVQGAAHELPQSGMVAYAIDFLGLSSTSTSPTAPGSPTATSSPTSSPSPTPTPTPTTPSPTAGGSACAVTYAVSPWNTGLTANVTVKNTSTSAVNGWRLAFTLPGGQAITSAWNATVSPSTGAVTATNVSYNASIPPGGSQSFGFNANHTGNTASPASFALNGTTCS